MLSHQSSSIRFVKSCKIFSFLRLLFNIYPTVFACHEKIRFYHNSAQKISGQKSSLAISCFCRWNNKNSADLCGLGINAFSLQLFFLWGAITLQASYQHRTKIVPFLNEGPEIFFIAGFVLYCCVNEFWGVSPSVSSAEIGAVLDVLRVTCVLH